MIYEENACFDPNCLQEEELVQSENGFSKNQHNFSIEELQSHPQSQQPELEFQNQLNLEMEHCYNNNTNNEMQSHLIHEIVQEMNNFNSHVQNGHFTTTPLAETPYPNTIFSSLLPNSSSSINFSNSTQKNSSSFLASLGLLGDLNSPITADGSSGSGSVVFDPLLPLNLPPQPQPPLLRELFHPGGGNFGIDHGSLFNGGVDERGHQINGGLFGQDGDRRNFENGVFVFNAGEMDCLVKNEGKGMKHYTTERHRRVLLKDKYDALRSLVPNPTKTDRASIVGDAIEYIQELKRTVNELKVLMEKKRSTKARLKRPKTENEEILEGNGLNSSGDMDNPYNGSSVRSSWLHRKSKNTEVDVRIIDDEVNVKLVQQKRINCLLFASRVLDELQLDLHHVAGGLIGDYYSFLFNSKISEGSIVYASAIADKLIEVVDEQYAAILPTSSY